MSFVREFLLLGLLALLTFFTNSSMFAGEEHLPKKAKKLFNGLVMISYEEHQQGQERFLTGAGKPKNESLKIKMEHFSNHTQGGTIFSLLIF